MSDPGPGTARPATLEVTFDASGAAEAGARRRVVCVVDVVDSSTSAEAALSNAAVAALGAAPADATPPVPVDPTAVARRAAALARERGTDVLVVAEPRAGDEARRRERAEPVLATLAGEGVGFDLVSNQGAELPELAKLDGRVIVVVSATGGTAYDAALAAGAPGACFATTARVEGLTGSQVAARGAERAASLAVEHGTGLSIVAASANSLDDALGSFEIARRVVESGFLRP